MAKARVPKRDLLDGDRLGEVSGEAEEIEGKTGSAKAKLSKGIKDALDVDAVHDSKPVREDLERKDVDETLETVDRLGHPDESISSVEAEVLVVADDDWREKEAQDRSVEEGRRHRERKQGRTGLTLPGLDLLESTLNLGVQTVLGHDEDDADKKARSLGVND